MSHVTYEQARQRAVEAMREIAADYRIATLSGGGARELAEAYERAMADAGWRMTPDRRITELLEANNHEVERRRQAEAAHHAVQHALQKLIET